MVKIIVWLGCMLVLLSFVAHAQASEGRFTLAADTVTCEGISLWRDEQYKVIGRCQGLVYPYAQDYTAYVLWAVPVTRDGTPIRLGEVLDGYIDGRSEQAFSRIFITAEKESSVTVPAGADIVSGTIEGFRFPAGGQTGQVAVAPEDTVHTVAVPPPPAAPKISFGRTFGGLTYITLLVIGLVAVGYIFFVRKAG